MQALDRKEFSRALDQLGQRLGLRKGSPAAPSFAGLRRVGRLQRLDLLQIQAGGQLLIDSGLGRIPGSVRAVDGDAGPDKLPQQTPDSRLHRESRQRAEGHRMMRNDQVSFLKPGLVRAFRCYG